MKSRDQRRLEKQKARDERLETIYMQSPRLKEIDHLQQSIVVQKIKYALAKDAHVSSNLEMQYNLLQNEKKEILSSLGLSEAVYEPEWDCPLCQDRGYLEPGVLCTCFIEEKKQLRYQSGGIDLALQQCQFDNFDTHVFGEFEEKTKEKIERLKKMAQYITQNKPIGNVILRGLPGRGKTHLAIATACRVIDAGKKAVYISTDALLDDMRQSQFDEHQTLRLKEVMAPYIESDLLILDDLGNEAATQFSIARLTYLIEERTMRQKPWIITTNLTLDEIGKRYGSRLKDRLIQDTTIFVLESPMSYRRLRDTAQRREKV